MILQEEEFAFPLHTVKTTVIHHRDTTSMKYVAIRPQYDETELIVAWEGGVETEGGSQLFETAEKEGVMKNGPLRGGGSCKCVSVIM